MTLLATPAEQTAVRPHGSPRPPAATRAGQGRVAIAVVNYADYGPRYLAECYRTLCAQSFPAERFTVFIVNNEVTDENKRFAELLAPQARFVNNGRNLGWTGGTNTAVKLALKEGFDYLVTLNMDMVLDANWLAELVRAAEASPDVHIFQSKILLHGTNRINSLGNKVQFLGHGYCYGYGDDASVPRAGVQMDYASGAAMLVKREVFERIGLFRDEYFMYYDDVEFCWRARLAGFNLGLVQGSVCYHKYDFHNILSFLYYVLRNRFLTLLTLARWRTLALLLPCLIVSEIFLGAYYLLRGMGTVHWKLGRYFLRGETWRTIAARRREIRTLRVRRDAEIFGTFSGKVVFAEVRNPLLRYVCNPLLALYWAAVRVFLVW